MANKQEKDNSAIENPGLTEEEKEFIDGLQAQVMYPKGTIFLSEDQIVNKSYHVITGCVRKFHLKDGEEKTTDFFTENDAIDTGSSRDRVVRSKYNLECVEDTTLTCVTAEQEKLLYTKFPRFQSLCRISTEEKLEEYQEMFSKFIASSPEERYLNLLETRPELLNRVPQYQLASYLGVKPESLSRIRKRLMG